MPEPEVTVHIPQVPLEKITPEINALVDAIVALVKAPKHIVHTEREVSRAHNLSVGTLRRYKQDLRKIFQLRPCSGLDTVANHPQLRSVVEYIVCRRDRSDTNALRSGADLTVIVPSTGDGITVEEFLKSLYTREGMSAASCYLALRARTLKKCVLTPTGSHASLGDLPSKRAVERYLQKVREGIVSVRRGRSRAHDWSAREEAYVTRDVTKLQPGELWIGDHAELDFIVLNERGKLDRRWITAFIDMRTSLLAGYHLDWQPSSATIALAYHNSVLGKQLRALTTEEHFEPVRIMNVPKDVMIDNGKDYRSKYTRRIFGKVDFEAPVRLSVQRTTRLHYVLPYHGQSKAQMERWFRTIQTMLKYLPGFKGNQYQNKPDSLIDDVKRGRILPVREFDAMVALAVNSYNNRVHRSLGGLSPLQCYLTNYTATRVIDPRVLDFLLMKVAAKPIRRCQVHMFGADYYSDALLKFNGQRADVYYDPLDLGFVSIYVRGKFATVASNKELIGQDERGWLRILKERKAAEQSMRQEIKFIRKGISNDEARMLALEGQLLNATPVSNELLDKKVPTITLLTGLEQDATLVNDEVEKEALIVKMRYKGKQRAKDKPLTVAQVVENIK